jgi:superfamily II DNA or RNA helicase
MEGVSGIKYALRPYQLKAKDEIREAMRNGARRVILRSEVGTGKTVCFSDLALSLIENKNPVMVVCNRKTLVGQAVEKLRGFGLDPAILMQNQLRGEPVLVVASADTLRFRAWPEWIRFVIIDECHLANFGYVLEEAKKRNLWTLGVSATPIPNKSNRLHELYQKMICTKRTEEHMLDGELEFDSYYVAKDAPDVSKLGMVKTSYGSDFKDKEVFALFNKSKMYDNMIENWLRMAKGKRTVCFCVSVEHSKKTAENFRAHGISAVHLDGSSSDAERKEAQLLFEKGVYHVLCNCAIFTFGWDCPSIECVIVNRATGSYELWRQMVGRGARPSEGKKGFLVIDQGGNYKRHGALMDEVVWSLAPPKKRKKGEEGVGVAPRKNCPHCEALIPVQSVDCQVCGEKLPVKEKTLVKAEFELVSPGAGLGLGSGSGKETGQSRGAWPEKAAYSNVEQFVRDCIRYQENYRTKDGKPMHRNAILYHIKGDMEAVRVYGKIKGYNEGWTKFQKALHE